MTLGSQVHNISSQQLKKKKMVSTQSCQILLS